MTGTIKLFAIGSDLQKEVYYYHTSLGRKKIVNYWWKNYDREFYYLQIAPRYNFRKKRNLVDGKID